MKATPGQEERVQQELARVKPQLTIAEWYSLGTIIEKLIRRLVKEMYEN